MRTGTIVYVAQGTTLPVEFDAATAARELGASPEWTEVAASAPGYYGVTEALLELARRGAGRVELVAARAIEGARLKLGEQRIRILG